MKKLTYLFLALLIVACSSDDSSDGNQLFLEKYDSIVWQRLPLSNDYDIRIAFINSSNSITQYGDEEGEEVYCSSYTIDGTINLPDNVIQTISIQEETENSLTIKKTRSSTNGGLYSFIVVFSVSESGNTLTKTIDYNSSQTWTRTFEEVCD